MRWPQVAVVAPPINDIAPVSPATRSKVNVTSSGSSAKIKRYSTLAMTLAGYQHKCEFRAGCTRDKTTTRTLRNRAADHPVCDDLGVSNRATIQHVASIRNCTDPTLLQAPTAILQCPAFITMASSCVLIVPHLPALPETVGVPHRGRSSATGSTICSSVQLRLARTTHPTRRDLTFIGYRSLFSG